jgi:sodium-dependent phosphate transporter
MNFNHSCGFSLTKQTTKTTASFFLRNSHVFLSKNTSPLFLREFLHVKAFPLSPNITKSLRNCKLTHPFASLSSFAEAEGEEGSKEEINHSATKNGEKENNSDEVSGMAKAFNISSRTASAITICIAMAALVFPLFMTSLGQGLTLKTKVLSYGTLLFGFYMAWNIGANDVANAMGTSVGSGALTLRQAVLTAAVLEFSGALLMGTHVTSTMQKGILVANVFQGKDSLLFAGLLSSLAAAGTWLQVNTLLVLQLSVGVCTRARACVCVFCALTLRGRVVIWSLAGR